MLIRLLLHGAMIGLLLLTAHAQAQTTLYVSTTGTTANPVSATSWATSTTNLQGAIDYVAANGGGQVWVASGVYKPSTNPAEREASFAMKNGVAIYGGFLGSETALTGRPAVNPITAEGRPGPPSSSTLSGDLLGDDGPGFDGQSENSYHVIRNPASLSLNSTAVLDGFVITGGNASGNANGDNLLGGGVYNEGDYAGQVCSPSFRNCLFTANQGLSGGAMYNSGRTAGSSSPQLTNCSFLNNAATGTGGGALLNDGNEDGSSNPTLTNCLFQGNSGSRGGAVHNSGYSSPQLTNCSFLRNSATNGGAMLNNGPGSPQLTNCSFQANSAAREGGAIVTETNNNPILTNCSFQANSAGTHGGAMYTFGYYGTCNLRLTNCSFLNNSASGTGINRGGAIYNTFSSAILTNCSFQGNSAINRGGAIYNTLNSNSSQLINCVLWNNSGDGAIYDHNGASTEITYCLIDNVNYINITGPGNLTASTSPFASTTSVALAACSPAIDAGNSVSYSAATSLTVDLAGNPRLVRTIDMGAMELQGPLSYPLALTLSPASESVVCAGSAVSVPVGLTGTVLGYQWYKDGSPVQSQTTATLSLPNVQTADAGSYSVVATGACNSVTSTCFSLTVNALPPVTITTNPSATLTCTSPSLTLTAQSSATALRWSAGETTASIAVSTTGLYSVTATAPNGCTAVSNSLSISQDLTLPPFSVNSVTVCQGQTVSLLASGCSGQVVWSTGATGSSLTVTAGSSTSVLTVSCTVGSCRAVASGSVVGQVLPPAAQILSLRADESTCPVRLLGQGVGTSFVFTGLGGYVFSAVFRTGGKYDVFAEGIKQPGTYTLTATYTNECGSNTPVSQTVTVSRSCP